MSDYAFRKRKGASRGQPFVLDGKTIWPDEVPGCWLPKFRKINNDENSGREHPRTRSVTGSVYQVGMTNSYLGAYDRDDNHDMFDGEVSNKSVQRRVNRNARVHTDRGFASNCSTCPWCCAPVEWELNRMTSSLFAISRTTGRAHVCDVAAIGRYFTEISERMRNALGTYLDTRQHIEQEFDETSPDTLTRPWLMRKHSARDMYFDCRDAVRAFQARFGCEAPFT